MRKKIFTLFSYDVKINYNYNITLNWNWYEYCTKSSQLPLLIALPTVASAQTFSFTEKSSVADPPHFDADPDPACHFEAAAGPDLTFLL